MANTTLYGDSAEHYRVVNDIALKYNENVINSARTGIIPDGSGRAGLSLGAGVGKTLVYDDTWTVGFRIYFDSQQGWGGQGPLYTASVANSLPMGMASIEHDGTISIWAGNRNTLIGNSGSFGFAIHGGTSYYIEIHTEISGGAPITASITLKVDGVQILNGSGNTGVNQTQTILNAVDLNYHQFQDANIVNGKAWMRDLYINNKLTNFFEGDIGLGAVFPYQDSGGSGFVPVGAGSLFAACNPQFPDINDDTIYIKAGTVADAAAFKFGPLTGTEPIPFVHYGIYHKKDNEGSRSFRLTMNGSDVSGDISSGDDFRYDFVALDKGPGGATWDVGLFNGTSFGLRITA